MNEMNLFDTPISYHIATYLEDYFESLEDALNYYNTENYIKPSIPRNTMKGKDNKTPRICVAKSVLECVNGLGIMGKLRRCCNNYVEAGEINGKEVYPVIILTFQEKLYQPIKEVPDAISTGEYWIKHAAKPINVEVKWLSMRSIEIGHSNDNKENLILCTNIKFIEPNLEHNHPWLNGKGSPLSSLDEEYLDGDILYKDLKNIKRLLSPYTSNEIIYENFHKELFYIEKISVGNNDYDENTILQIDLHQKEKSKNLIYSNKYNTLIPKAIQNEIYKIILKYL